MVEMSVTGLAIDDKTKTPVVLLSEAEGRRVLPIWIGPSEASSIAMELAGKKFQRPLTHDLLRAVIESLGAEVPKIAIVDLRDKTYFARVYLKRDDEVLTIDARPSDCIALALRTRSPIFVSEDLLREAEDDVGEMNKDQSMEDLQKQLEDMDPEEFGKLWS